MLKNDLQSDNATDCIYAIRACCIQHILDNEIIDELRKLKYDNRIAMMKKVSECAIAALDILGIEKYTGYNLSIIEIIKTNFYKEDN